MDSWLYAAAQNFRGDPELRRGLFPIADDPQTRKSVCRGET